MKSLSEQISNLINADRRTTSKRTEKVLNIKRYLDEPMQSLRDDERYICEQENEYFGVGLTYAAADIVGINTAYDCGSVLEDAPLKKAVVICGEVARWNETVTKNGKNKGQKMCFVTLEDFSGRLEAVCFSGNYSEEIASCLYKGSVVVAKGRVSDDRKSFFLDEVKLA